MRRVAFITAGLLLAAAAISVLVVDEWTSRVQAAPSRTITLFFSGWVQGNYGPCG
jgi:hypothetical protein